MREPWLVLVPTWARADGLCGTPDMSPALNYKALIYATPTHLPSICPFTRPHVIISALSMHLPPVLWAWIRAPATHFLGARSLTTLPLSIPPAAFSALPQHLPSPFSVIILSSQYLFQRGPIWILCSRSQKLFSQSVMILIVCLSQVCVLSICLLGQETTSLAKHYRY